MADRAKRLPPWREIGYFQRPNVIVTPVSGTMMTWAEIAPNNPNRVALLLSTSANADIWLTPDNTIPTISGIVISSAVPLLLLEAQVGNLATCAWYAFASSGGSVTAVESILREWPQPSF